MVRLNEIAEEKTDLEALYEQEKADLNQKHYSEARDLENRITINEELLKAEADRKGGNPDGE